jgi:N-methylhydantoinase B
MAGSSAAYHVSIERDGEVIAFDTPGKVTGFPVFRDDVVVMRSSGGGGYGHPLQRDPVLVADDVKRGIVSIEAARNLYGVALDASEQVDLQATTTLRAELAARHYTLEVTSDDAFDPYVGAKGKHRTVELSQEDAEALGVSNDDLVEMFGVNPAPLRAWVKVTARPRGAIRMDEFGRKVLGIGSGGRVVVRRVPTHAVAKGLAQQNRWE